MGKKTEAMEAVLPVVVTVLGFSVLGVYVFVFGFKVFANYFTHPFWLGIPESVVRVLAPLQLLAALGFLVSMGTWMKHPPTTGVMGRNPAALPLTVGVFLATAVVWPLAVYYKFQWLTVASLLGTAATSIAMLAGAVEESEPKWWVVLGLLLLCNVTVLGDGVVWNAKYISAARDSPDLLDTWGKN